MIWCLQEAVCLRLVILTDTHGNATALAAGLAAARRLGPDVTICAGDVAHFGPEPNECINLLAEACVPCVRGNHDRDLLMPIDLSADATVGQRALAAIHNWGHEHLSPAARTYLAQLPFAWHTEPVPGQRLLVIHASPEQDDEIVSDTDCLAHCERAGAVAVVAGHLHRAFVHASDAHLWVNAGSCGAAIDGDPRAVLAVLDWRAGRWEARIERVDYDLHRAAAATLKSGIPFADEIAASRSRAEWLNIPT